MKKSILHKSSEEIFQDIQSLQNDGGGPRIDFSRQESVQVRLEPNPKIAPGLFQPSRLHPKIYYAHPSTIKALRKDIFVTSEDLAEFSDCVRCPSCHREVDLQFWLLCPYCESKLRPDEK